MAQFVVPPANMTLPGVPFDPEAQARVMYWLGWRIPDIARAMDIPESTVKSWKARKDWDDVPVIQRASECTYVQYMRRIMKAGDYSSADRADIDLLARNLVGMARIEKFKKPGGNEADLNEKVGNRNKGPKKQVRQNYIGAEDQARLIAAFEDNLFEHQHTWRNSSAFTTRAILKSRQIGATHYFAREALIRALETGNNQIFISASRAQANIFRRYIVDFVFRETGVRLAGDVITIDRGDDEDGKPLPTADLLFLGTNYKTAQGYNGDVYIDEFFWIHGFEEIDTVASAMAAQKFYRVTYFSTPSTVHHQAYPLWTGERFNEDRPKADRVKIDISHAALKDGRECGDGVWRHIVTVEDALAGGFDRFNMDKIKLKYSIEQYERLFMCQFVDDSKSAFPLALVRPCLVDTWEKWKDFEPYDPHPYAGEVWLGYDPQESEDGDNAALVVVAAPRDKKSKFRVLDRFQWRGLDFQEQAEKIKTLCNQYRVTEIAIDTTGIGIGVHQLVCKFFPNARAILYSPLEKMKMVLKAQNVMRNRRLEMDVGTHKDIVAALMSIHPEQTKGGKSLTYVARRSAETGHGDLAWALLHALSCEPLDNTDGEAVKQSRIGITRNAQLDGQSQRQSRVSRLSRGEAQGVQLRQRRERGRRPAIHLHARSGPQWPILRAARRAA